MFIIRVRNGPDFFVSVAAVYKISDSGWYFCSSALWRRFLTHILVLRADFYELPAEEAGSLSTSASYESVVPSGIASSRGPLCDEEEPQSRTVSADQPRTRIGKFKAAAASMKSKAEDGTENIRNAIGAFSGLKIFDDKKAGSKSERQRRVSSYL
jgi:hypothetical protein